MNSIETQPPQPIRVLVAEDDDRTRSALVSLLQRHGYHVSVVKDGHEALGTLIKPNPPSIVLLDWEMPQLDGPHVCRALRTIQHQHYVYVIMITGRDSPADLLTAFAAGVDDFLSKPVDASQLLARMRSGERILALETRLAERITALEKTLKEMGEIKRLLPICMYCKKVRNDSDYWQGIESYIHEHTGADFSHGICPTCVEVVLKRDFDAKE